MFIRSNILNSKLEVLSVLEPDQLISHLRQSCCAHAPKPPSSHLSTDDVPLIPKGALQKMVHAEALEPMLHVILTQEILLEWPAVFA